MRLRGTLAMHGLLATMVLLTMLGVTVPSASAGHFTTGNEQVLLSNEEWKNSQTGLSFWPDGPMGIERDGPLYTFHTPNGPNVARTVGTLFNPIATSVEPSIEIEGARDLPDAYYASGGPIYDVPGSDMKLMFVHIEQSPSPYNTWYAPVGLARSTDEGHSWQFLGQILTHEISYEDWKDGHSCAHSTFNTGFGQYVIHTVGGVDYFYAYGYSTNVDSSGCTTPLGVARAPVADVVAAAANETVSPWHKYYDGAWNEPGIGGRATNVLRTGDLGPHSVVYNDYRGRYVMAVSFKESVLGLLSSRVDLYESVDGVTWGPRDSLPKVLGEAYAPTLVGLGDDPSRPGKSMYVYYTYALNPGEHRFNTSDLRRRLITYR